MAIDYRGKTVKKLSLLSLICLSLSGCATSDDINFERMNNDELQEYNRDRSLGQMIVCSEEQRTTSWISRRRCATVEQMYGSVQQAEKLGVLNSAPRL